MDSDSPYEIVWAWRTLKGLYFLRKLPEKVRQTERGIHLIYSDLPITENKMLMLRKAIGDDENRIRLDMIGNRLQNVLFTEKVTTCIGYIHPVWFKYIIKKKCPSPNFDICLCGKKVITSSKIWTKKKKALEIVHKDGSCCFPIRQKKSILLNLLEKMGVEIV